MKLKIYFLIIAILVFSVPWLFTSKAELNVLGLPLWAAFSFIASFIFAVAVAYVIGKYWDKLSE